MGRTRHDGTLLSRESIVLITLSPSHVCHRNSHAPFKRAQKDLASPVRAMFWARRKMARTGHADRAGGRDGPEEVAAGRMHDRGGAGREPQLVAYVCHLGVEGVLADHDRGLGRHPRPPPPRPPAPPRPKGLPLRPGSAPPSSSLYVLWFLVLSFQLPFGHLSLDLSVDLSVLLLLSFSLEPLTSLRRAGATLFTPARSRGITDLSV